MTTLKPVKVPIELLNANLQVTVDFKDTENTEHKCTLCRKHLMASTHGDMAKGIMTSKVSLGKCKHAFHKECIDASVKSGSLSCPIDGTPWTFGKELDSVNSYKQFVSPEEAFAKQVTPAKKPVVSHTIFSTLSMPPLSTPDKLFTGTNIPVNLTGTSGLSTFTGTMPTIGTTIGTTTITGIPSLYTGMSTSPFFPASMMSTTLSTSKPLNT